MEPKDGKKGIMAIDGIMTRITTVFSWCGVIACVVSACLSVADIFAAKFFSGGIRNQYQWIQYFMIIVVFAFLPIVVNQKGLMSVDILTRKFPGWLLKGINIFSYVAGTVLFSFLAYNGIALLNKHIVQKTASANQTGAFLIWPFTLFFVIGLILLSITCIWKTIKLCATPSAGFVKTDSKKDKEKEEEK